MRISKEINQLILKKFITLNPSSHKSYFEIINGDLLLKAQIPKNLKIPTTVKIKNIAYAILMLFVSCSQIIRAPIGEKKTLTLVYSLSKEQIFRRKEIAELQLFFAQRRFNIKSSNKILVESKSIILSRNQGNVNVVFDISLKLFVDYAGLKLKINILRNMLVRFMFLLLQLKRETWLVLAAKEFIIDEPIIDSLKSQISIDKVITSISSLNYQPLIFEIDFVKGKRYMIWYSVNTIPFTYNHIVEQDKIWLQNKDVFKYESIDVHWVWNAEHKKYLSDLTASRIDVKGSMVFYQQTIKIPEFLYDIVLFDVTPASEKFSFHPIYNFGLLSQFVEDILDISQQVSMMYSVKISVAIKQKREISKRADKRYIKLLRNLEANGSIQILPWSENLYNLLSASKLSISFPFTAPSVISKELNISTAYYLPKNLLVSSNKVNGIPFFQSKSELNTFILETLLP